VITFPDYWNICASAFESSCRLVDSFFIIYQLFCRKTVLKIKGGKVDSFVAGDLLAGAFPEIRYFSKPFEKNSNKGQLFLDWLSSVILIIRHQKHIEDWPVCDLSRIETKDFFTRLHVFILSGFQSGRLKIPPSLIEMDDELPIFQEWLKDQQFTLEDSLTTLMPSTTNIRDHCPIDFSSKTFQGSIDDIFGMTRQKSGGGYNSIPAYYVKMHFPEFHKEMSTEGTNLGRRRDDSDPKRKPFEVIVNLVPSHAKHSTFENLASIFIYKYGSNSVAFYMTCFYNSNVEAMGIYYNQKFETLLNREVIEEFDETAISSILDNYAQKFGLQVRHSLESFFSFKTLRDHSYTAILHRPGPRDTITPKLSDYCCSRKLLRIRPTKIPSPQSFISPSFNPTSVDLWELSKFGEGLVEHGMSIENAIAFILSPLQTPEFNLEGDNLVFIDHKRFSHLI
jgi:hypothetical protein